MYRELLDDRITLPLAPRNFSKWLTPPTTARETDCHLTAASLFSKRELRVT